MTVKLFSVLLALCTANCSEVPGKHVLRLVTFCQKNVTGDGQNDIEFDGDQLLYTNPFTHQPVQRLPEFAHEWVPDPGLPHDSYVNLGTCYYNLPRAAVGEHFPPENIASPASLIYPKQEIEIDVPNTLICFVNNFHPPTLDIVWKRNGRPVDQSYVSQTQYYSNQDFTFHMASYLEFTPQVNDIYSCSVEHVSLSKPLVKFLEVKGTDQQLVETAVCVCGVILGLIGVITGLWFIMKANKSCQA